MLTVIVGGEQTMKEHFLLGVIGCLCISCTGYQQGKRLQHLITRDSAQVTLNRHYRDSITLYYTGCAGFLIRKGDNALLHDPFFSHAGPLALLNFQHLRSDTARIDSFFRQQLGRETDTAGIIKAVLVSHTHYDHVLDVPYIYQKKLNKESVFMYGNLSLQRLLLASEHTYQSPVPDGHVRVVEEQAAQAGTPGQWFYTPNRRIRFLPIITEHAPHFYFIRPIRFYTGQVKPKLTKLPEKPNGYKEGQSLAYLIDFLRADGTIDFRMYIQGSASNAPYGFPPVLQGKDAREVDVAVICVASFQYVKEYPKAIIRYLKPHHVILAHWENFFQPLNKLAQHPMTVPFTDVPKFLRRLKRSMTPIGRDTAWTLPAPNTRIQIKY